jgi:hypothetical protein
MSIHTLPRPAVSPVVEHACSDLDTARQVELELVPDGDLEAAVQAAAVLESQAKAFELALLAEAERRQSADRAAATGTDAWAAALTGDTREVMRGGLRLAKLLRDKYAFVREAFAAGRLRTAQVRVIVNAAEQMPPEVTAEQRAIAEEILVAKATGDGTHSGRPMNAKRLRQAARRMLEPVDTELADRHEAILLGREHRNAEAETFLMLHDNGDGTFSGRFTIPELHGHLFAEALQRLSAPRRLGRDQHGDEVTDESAPETNIYELHGLAFCELLEHLPEIGHAANGLTTLVTIRLEALLSGLGTARLDTGTRITAGEARRLACNAALVPVLLGTDSVPLDLGREARLHTKHQAPSTKHQAPSTSVAPWPPSTTPARSTAASAPSPGARSTTRTPGPAAGAPTSTTPSPCAATTTDAPTTTASPSPANPTVAGDSTPADRPMSWPLGLRVQLSSPLSAARTDRHSPGVATGTPRLPSGRPAPPHACRLGPRRRREVLPGSHGQGRRPTGCRASQ